MAKDETKPSTPSEEEVDRDFLVLQKSTPTVMMRRWRGRSTILRTSCSDRESSKPKPCVRGLEAV
jgi:hypothetical protein